MRIVFSKRYFILKLSNEHSFAVTRVACGHNHTVALCSDGGVWTWGFGGFGRLGHKVQQDEFKPRLVETLTGRVQIPEDAIIAAGSTSSFATMVSQSQM